MIFLRTLVLAKRLFGFLTQIRLVRQHWTLQNVCCYSNKGKDAAHHTEEYRQAGHHGCVGSTDATHILLEQSGVLLFATEPPRVKTTHTASTYNITANHRRLILATTSINPACWSDKTLVLFHDFVVFSNEGWKRMQDFTFKLYGRNLSGNIILAKYRGPRLIVDSGYLNWPTTTVPPFKQTCSQHEIRFSQWL